MKLRPLRRPPARSLYFRLLQLGLALVLLPSLLIGIAWIYEHFATRAQTDHLARIPLMIDALDSVSPDVVATRERVVVAWLDAQGRGHASHAGRCRSPTRRSAAWARRSSASGAARRWTTRTRSFRPGRRGTRCARRWAACGRSAGT